MAYMSGAGTYGLSLLSIAILQKIFGLHATPMLFRHSAYVSLILSDNLWQASSGIRFIRQWLSLRWFMASTTPIGNFAIKSRDLEWTLSGCTFRKKDLFH